MALLYELEIQYFRYANYERASFFQNRTEDPQVGKKKILQLSQNGLFVCVSFEIHSVCWKHQDKKMGKYSSCFVKRKEKTRLAHCTVLII